MRASVEMLVDRILRRIAMRTQQVAGVEQRPKEQWHKFRSGNQETDVYNSPMAYLSMAHEGESEEHATSIID